MEITGTCAGMLIPGARRLCHPLILLAMLYSSIGAQAAQPPHQNKFLIVSDIHFNPMADASLVSQLTAAEPEDWEAILQGSKPAAFSQYGEDTNWWLLQSALDQMQTTLPHPAFIMVNGDALAHRFPQTYLSTTQDSDRGDYRKFVFKTVKFLALEFRKRFKDAPIFLTPGNNDEECGNYSIEAGGRFLHDTSDVVRDLARGDDQLRASWEDLGSYDIPHPSIRGVRIISINTVFFSNKYHAARFNEGCSAVSSTAASDLFTWLESRLVRAQQAHEKVWLMFHIPPGIDSYSTAAKYQTLPKSHQSAAAAENTCASAIVPMWVPQWTLQFDSLVAKFSATVIASFAGHTHSDDFRLINSSSPNPSFVLITSSISPVYDQNPGFRVATFADDGSLVDQSVYYLTNLEYASSKTRGEWKQEYTFSQEWKQARLNAASLGAIYDRITSKQTDRDEWLKLYNVSSSAVHLPPTAAQGIYCAVAALDPQAYANCYCAEAIKLDTPADKP